jgi:glucose-1-phosphate cytidylyltransferase
MPSGGLGLVVEGNRMKTMILCGGAGTRMREETEFRPKPMVDVGGRPILWHIMKYYSHFGYSDFILCLGYRANMIKEYFLNYEAMNNDFRLRLGGSREIQYLSHHPEDDFTVTLSDTGVETMTGARVKRAAVYLDSDHFMVTYGDGLSDVNLNKLVEFHLSHGKLATITSVRPISRFGVLELGDSCKVRSFAEKPAAPGWINSGHMVFHRDALAYFDAAPDCIMERAPMERLVRDGQLMAYQHEGFFFAMDTYREYAELNALWAHGQAPWKVWDDRAS